MGDDLRPEIAFAQKLGSVNHRQKQDKFLRRLWQCFDEPGRLDEVLDDLADAFGEDRTQVEKDCMPLLRTWVAENLIAEVDRG